MDFNYFEKLCSWVGVKASLFRKKQELVLRQGQIWWSNIGMNVGEESYGKGDDFARPVLIFKKFSSDSFLGLPLTSKKKEGTWYAEIDVNGEPGWIMLNQARILDKKRLIERLSIVKIEDFEVVKKKFHDLYCL